MAESAESFKVVWIRNTGGNNRGSLVDMVCELARQASRDDGPDDILVEKNASRRKFNDFIASSGMREYDSSALKHILKNMESVDTEAIQVFGYPVGSGISRKINTVGCALCINLGTGFFPPSITGKMVVIGVPKNIIPNLMQFINDIVQAYDPTPRFVSRLMETSPLAFP